MEDQLAGLRQGPPIFFERQPGWLTCRGWAGESSSFVLLALFLSIRNEDGSPMPHVGDDRAEKMVAR